MTKPLEIPDCLTKRDLLFSPEGEEVDHGAYGDLFFEERRYMDALLFYLRSGDKDKIARLRGHAVKTGDYSLLARIDREEGLKLSADQWREAAEHALALGKERYAADMFERAGDEARAAETRAKFAPPAPGGEGEETREDASGGDEKTRR